MATAKTREINKRAIYETIKAFAGKKEADFWMPYFHATAVRESGLSHVADARSDKDKNGARKAFERTKATLYASNRWVDAPYLWHNSIGLFQLMIPNHLHRLSREFHPHILYNPVAATVVAMRLVNKLISQGARNMYELRAGWAGGPGYWNRDPDRQGRKASQKKRFASLGYDPAITDANVGYIPGVGMGPNTDDVDRINEIARRIGTMRIGVLASNSDSIPSEWGDEFIEEDDLPEDNEDVSNDHVTKKPRQWASILMWGLIGFLLGKDLKRS